MYRCSWRGSQVVIGGGNAAAAERVARVQRVGRGRVQRALARGGGAPAPRRLPRAAAHARHQGQRARALRPRHALRAAAGQYCTRNTGELIRATRAVSTQFNINYVLIYGDL